MQHLSLNLYITPVVITIKMYKTNLTQRRQAEDDSDVLFESDIGDTYCWICTERIEFCRCEPGEGANRVDSPFFPTDSDLLEDVEYTRMRRTSSEFVSVGGVRDF